MDFKHEKKIVLNNISAAIYGTNLKESLFSYDQAFEIREYVRRTVEDAFEELLDNIYTSPEFERDLGLK